MLLIIFTLMCNEEFIFVKKKLSEQRTVQCLEVRVLLVVELLLQNHIKYQSIKQNCGFPTTTEADTIGVNASHFVLNYTQKKHFKILVVYYISTAHKLIPIVKYFQKYGSC